MCVFTKCFFLYLPHTSTHHPPFFPLGMTFRYGHRLMWLTKAGIGVWQERLPMFPSLSRCQPSGHTVGSQEVTPGNFLFDQPIDAHRPLYQFSSKQGSSLWTWHAAYAEKGSPMGSTVYVEHKGAKDIGGVSELCVCSGLFATFATACALSWEKIERDEMRTNKCRRREAALSSILPVGLKRAGKPFSLQQIRRAAPKETLGTERKKK